MVYVTVMCDHNGIGGSDFAGPVGPTPSEVVHVVDVAGEEGNPGNVRVSDPTTTVDSRAAADVSGTRVVLLIIVTGIEGPCGVLSVGILGGTSGVKASMVTVTVLECEGPNVKVGTHDDVAVDGIGVAEDMPMEAELPKSTVTVVTISAVLVPTGIVNVYVSVTQGVDSADGGGSRGTGSAVGVAVNVARI